MKKFLLIIGAFLLTSGFSHADHEDGYFRQAHAKRFDFTADLSVKFTEDASPMNRWGYSEQESNRACTFLNYQKRKKSETIAVNRTRCNAHKTHFSVIIYSFQFLTGAGLDEAWIKCAIPKEVASHCNKIKVSHINEVLLQDDVPVQIIYNH